MQLTSAASQQDGSQLIQARPLLLMQRLSVRETPLHLLIISERMISIDKMAMKWQGC